MGNALTRDYDLRGQAATGGPGGLWKVYDAVRKSNGRSVSVWVRPSRQTPSTRPLSHPKSPTRSRPRGRWLHTDV